MKIIDSAFRNLFKIIMVLCTVIALARPNAVIPAAIGMAVSVFVLLITQNPYTSSRSGN